MAAALFVSYGLRSEASKKGAQRDDTPKDQAQRDDAPKSEAPKNEALIDQKSTQTKKLTASDASIGAFFSASVAIYGNTAIIGAGSGAIYIFERGKEDNWGEAKKLNAPDGKSLENPRSVAIYADTAIVGIDGEAYIFERHKGGANEWGVVKELSAPDAESYALFGSSVAIYKDRAVVGATVGEADYEKNGLGAAYIFERNRGGSNNWGKVKKLTGSDRSKDDGYDEFGDSVAIYGDTAIVGAAGNPLWANDRSAAYIFERNKGGADNWGEVKKLNAPDGEDAGGDSVAIYGNMAIVGGGGDWDTDGGGRGSAYIYERNKGGANNWGEVKKLTPPDLSDRSGFGSSVAIYADRAIVGARGQGSAYIFERNRRGADNWEAVDRLNASDGDGDMFGCSVAIYENTTIVGASEADNGGGEGSQQGAAYIFSLKTLR